MIIVNYWVKVGIIWISRKQVKLFIFYFCDFQNGKKPIKNVGTSILVPRR